MLKLKHILGSLVLVATSSLASPPGFPNGRVLRLSNGINQIDIDGQNSQAMAVLAHRENFNAHGFEVLTLYIKKAAPHENPNEWSLVPVFDDTKEHLELTIGGGADCLLHDFRLVTEGKGHPLRLVVAHRDLGESFADPNAVQFSFYELRTNEKGLPGLPLYYFERVKQLKARHRYCDVGEAFKNELGFSDWRISRP